MGAYDDAIDYYNKGIGVLSLIVKKGTYGDLTLPKIYNHMGLAYAKKGDMRKAIASFQKSIEIAFRGGYNSLGAWALYNAADCFGKLNKYDTALSYCNMSYEIFDRYDDKLGLAGVTMSYALIYKLMGDTKKAEEQFKETIRLREEVGVPYMMGDAYMEYGALLKQKGDLKKAKQYLEKALYTFMKIRNRSLTERMVKEIESLESQTSYLT
jgi:tetratricopeptide (TPR) repeat protein